MRPKWEGVQQKPRTGEIGQSSFAAGESQRGRSRGRAGAQTSAQRGADERSHFYRVDFFNNITGERREMSIREDPE